jgi:hypothetical protein
MQQALNYQSMTSVHLALSKKICGLCRTALCQEGQYLPLENTTLRHKWVCRRCLQKGTQPIVQNALKINALNPLKVLAWRTGSSCPPECLAATRGVCSVATRYAAAEKLRAQLDLMWFDETSDPTC